MNNFLVVFDKANRVPFTTKAQGTHKMMRPEFNYFFHSLRFLSKFTDAPVNIALTIPGIINGYRPNSKALSTPTNKASCGSPTIKRQEEPPTLYIISFNQLSSLIANEDARIEVVEYMDDVCTSCPNKIDEIVCKTQDKITKLDIAHTKAKAG